MPFEVVRLCGGKSNLLIPSLGLTRCTISAPDVVVIGPGGGGARSTLMAPVQVVATFETEREAIAEATRLKCLGADYTYYVRQRNG